MTPKERVLMALSHQEPDRVPIGEWEYGKEIINPAIGRETLAFDSLKRTEAYWAGRRDDVIQDWKDTLSGLVRNLGWDTILVHNVIGKDTPIEVPEQISADTWEYPNGDILTYSRETDRLMFTKKGAPQAATQPAESKASAPAPADLDPTDSELELVRDIVKEFGKTHFIFGGALSGHPKLGFCDATVSEVETWVSLYEDPDQFSENLMSRFKDPDAFRGVAVAKREGIDGITCGWDFGCNSGTFMSPELFKKVIQPYLSGLADGIHRQGLPMLLHSCGKNQAVMDMIVEAGVDVYQSIQPEMEIMELKKRYGKNITLWGGVPAGDLITSSPEQVRKTAEMHLRACKPGGGYIFGTSHSIMPGARYENYLAMLEAHKTFGRYE